MNFSDKLKELRRNEGLSQEQLAERIGVSRQAITKWETGKGLPDIENMIILAGIFGTTIDELVSDAAARTEKPGVFTSKTIYDIDRERHFDIHIGSAKRLLLTSGGDEKLHVCLKSDTAENIAELYKIKLDGRSNRLEARCAARGGISAFEASSSVEIEVTLPAKYAEHCEVSASVGVLELLGLSVPRLEYDGGADSVIISRSGGSFEFTTKSDLQITADAITGQLSIYQFRAKTLLRIPESVCPAVKIAGRKCSVVWLKDGKPASAPNAAVGIKFSGVGSELAVDMTK